MNTGAAHLGNNAGEAHQVNHTGGESKQWRRCGGGIDNKREKKRARNKLEIKTQRTEP